MQQVEIHDYARQLLEDAGARQLPSYSKSDEVGNARRERASQDLATDRGGFEAYVRPYQK